MVLRRWGLHLYSDMEELDRGVREKYAEGYLTQRRRCAHIMRQLLPTAGVLEKGRRKIRT